MKKNHLVLRQLSVSETFYVDFKISIQLVCDLKGSLSPQVVQRALIDVTRYHAFLGCQIIRDNEQLYFVQANADIQFQVVDARDNGNARKSAMRAELNAPLNESTSLMRVLMLQNPLDTTLIFTLHHAIADGLSSVELVKDILATCSHYLKSETPLTGNSLPAQASIEELGSPLITADELSVYIDEFEHKIKAVSLKSIQANPLEDGVATSIEVINSQFSVKESQMLFALCKSNKTSIHCGLAAAHLIAIRELLDDSDNELFLRCNSPVDLRRRLHPPLNNKHLLSAATGCGTNHAVSPKTSLWKLAQEIGSDLKKALENRDVFKAHLSFKDTLMKHRVPTAIGVSSVGQINIPELEGLECYAFYLTGVYELPMFGVTACTFSQKLNLTYMFVQPYYSPQLIKNLARRVKKKIQTLA